METKSQSSQVAGLEDHLGYWMRRVSNQVSGSFVRALEQRQTSVAEWVLLRLLYERRQASPGELADAMSMTRGAVSKIVAKAEAKQWILSSPDPEDARGQRLRLTGKGRRVVPELANIAEHNDERFFGGLTRNERTELRRILGKLTQSNEIRAIAVE